jgi:hypothetical protein
MDKQVSISKSEDELRLLYAVVYQPDTVDAHNDFMTADSIRVIAHDFIKNNRAQKVDVDHNRVESGASVVESFLARAGDPDFVEGSWVVCIHVDNDDLWQSVKNGELNGLSMSITALSTERGIEIEVPTEIQGVTSERLGHTHNYVLYFDEEGEFLGGETDTVNGHKHLIKRGTITEDAQLHNHQYSYMENLSNVKVKEM